MGTVGGCTAARCCKTEVKIVEKGSADDDGIYEASRIELPPAEHFKSVEAIVLAAADFGVTGTLNLSSNAEGEEKVEGLLRTHSLPLLKKVPPSVFELCGKRITTLTLSGNEVNSIAGVGALCVLEVLDVSENHLETLPSEEIASLRSTLRVLDLSDNQLSVLPSGLGACYRLEILRAFKNELTTLPKEIGQCRALFEINLFNNRITSLPDSLSTCSELEILNIGGNKLQTLPNVAGWVKMRDLKAHQNGLRWKGTDVPDFVPMIQLECLKIDGCKVMEALPTFGKHLALELFDVSHCQIASLPPPIVSWSALRTLDCSYNSIKDLPPIALPCLELLNVCNNAISTLPPELGQCFVLKTLFCHSNNITEVPPDLAALAPSIMRMNFSAQRQPGLRMDETMVKLRAACQEKAGRFIGPDSSRRRATSGPLNPANELSERSRSASGPLAQRSSERRGTT